MNHPPIFPPPFTGNVRGVRLSFPSLDTRSYFGQREYLQAAHWGRLHTGNAVKDPQSVAPPSAKGATSSSGPSTLLVRRSTGLAILVTPFRVVISVPVETPAPAIPPPFPPIAMPNSSRFSSHFGLNPGISESEPKKLHELNLPSAVLYPCCRH